MERYNFLGLELCFTPNRLAAKNLIWVEKLRFLLQQFLGWQKAYLCGMWSTGSCFRYSANFAFRHSFAVLD
jgi:hypothetical protein